MVDNNLPNIEFWILLTSQWNKRKFWFILYTLG